MQRFFVIVIMFAAFLLNGTSAWSARYVDLGDGTVLDSVNSLRWLKNANCLDAAGGITKNINAGKLNWYDATTWSNNLKQGICLLNDGSGVGAWHLPSKAELSTLFASPENYRDNSLNTVGFYDVKKYYYWSSTEYTDDTSFVWGGWTSDASFTGLLKGGMTSYVWPVRSAPLHELVVTPTVTDFGAIQANKTSASQTYTLNNPNVIQLNVSSITLTGGDNTMFTLVTGDGTGGTCGAAPAIPPGGSCTVSTTFTPTQSGAKATTLRIISNSVATAIKDVSLSGTSIAVSFWRGDSIATDSVGSNHGSTVNKSTTVSEGTAAYALASCGVGETITSFSAIYGSQCGIPVDCSQGMINYSCKVGTDQLCYINFNNTACNNGDPCPSIVKTGTLDLSCSSTDATMFAAGKVGQAFSFDGAANHYISIPDNRSLDLTTGHAVVSWVKLNALPTPAGKFFYLVNKWTNAKEDKRLTVDSGGFINYALFGTSGAVVTSTARLSVNRWYHIAAMYDGKAVKLYIDGVLDKSTPASGAVSNGTGRLFFGYNPDRVHENYEIPFSGLLDEVGWYSRALTAAEISTSFAGECGTSNGASFAIAPTTNLCSAGTASEVTGTGSWAWTCSVGATASCTASLQGTVVIPKTGQTTSYAVGDDGDKKAGAAQTDTVFTDNGTTITDKVYGMTWEKNAGKYGATIKSGIFVPYIRFTDNGNGTQTDNLTGLVWLKNAGCFATVGGISKGTTADTSALNWYNALAWSNNLKHGDCDLLDGSVAGDWRLPNIDELASLPTNFEAIPSDWLNNARQGFTNVQYGVYWSSSSFADDTYTAWGLDGNDPSGNAFNDYKFFSHYVWPVRGGQSGSLGSLDISKDGTGTGSISSVPARISCGATCTANFAAGTSVIITATAVTGNFGGWSGCDSTNGNQCTVTAAGAKNVMATFTLLPIYQVTYDGKSPTSGAAPDAQIKIQGIDLTLATNSSSLVKTGYTFVGWNTSFDGTGITYAVDATYSTDAPLALFAKWALNGVCGADNGAPFTVAPTTNLCTVGTPSIVTGTGPWRWSCSAGITASCSAYLYYLPGTIVLPKTGQTNSYAVGDDGDKQAGAVQNDPLFTDNGNGTITDKVYGMTWQKNTGENGASIPMGIVGVPATRFTDNGNGTQTDNLTGLIWLKNLSCFPSAQTWASALNSANTLKGDNTQCSLTDGSVAGDWRLPNINELASLSTNRNEAAPIELFNTAGFSNVMADYYYWSSSYAFIADYAWIVSLGYGDLSYDDKAGSHYVWPVRGGQSGLGTLATSKTGTGAGSVSSNPARISCGTTCSASFTKGQLVEFVATTDSGNFAGWTGCDSIDADNKCKVTATGAKSVTATFALAATLTVNLPGSGSGTVTSTAGVTPQFSCKANCSKSVAYNSDVTLSATESLGSAPVVWSGACSNVPCSFKMDGDKTANADFTVYQYLKNGAVYYGTVKDALATAKSSEAVKAKTMQMLDSGVTFDTGLLIFLYGGYANIDDAASSGYTTLVGPLKIKSGTLKVDRVKVK